MLLVVLGVLGLLLWDYVRTRRENRAHDRWMAEFAARRQMTDEQLIAAGKPTHAQFADAAREQLRSLMGTR